MNETSIHDNGNVRELFVIPVYYNVDGRSQ
jgi:hypothetical protein